MQSGNHVPANQVDALLLAHRDTGASRAFVKSEKYRRSRINIYPEYLQPSHLDLMIQLLEMIIQDESNSLKLILNYDDSPYFIPSGEIRKERGITRLTASPSANIDCMHWVLFAAKVAVFEKHNMMSDTERWYMLQQGLDYTGIITDKFKQLPIIVKWIYDKTTDKSAFMTLLPQIITRCINANNLEMMYQHFDEAMLNDAIRKVDDPNYPFLHFAIRKNRESTIERLFKIYDGFDLPLYDKCGSSLMHHCLQEKYFERLYAWLPHPDYKNKFGESVLRSAAKCNNQPKYDFLLSKGASKRSYFVENESVHDILSTNNYLTGIEYEILYSVNITSLGVPITQTQKGHDCGLTAMAIATKMVHQLHQPDRVDGSLPACKMKMSPHSFRQYAKSLNFTLVGEMFSATNLASLAEKNNCHADVASFNTYDEFMLIIKTSIDARYPVLMPFNSNKGKADVTDLSGRSAHWATIYAYISESAANYLVTTQYGKTIVDEAAAYFKACTSLANVPSCFFYKGRNKIWSKLYSEPQAVSAGDKVLIMPTQDLGDFNNKLIIVKPPARNI